jgi:hypothetical protein
MTLRAAWEAEAENWIAWARKPGHDSYWKFHRDAFLAGLPAPPARVVDVGCGAGLVGVAIGVRLTQPSGCTHDPCMTCARSPMAMPGRSIRRRG